MSGWPKYKEVVRGRDQLKRERDEAERELDRLAYIIAGQTDIRMGELDEAERIRLRAAARSEGGAK